MRGVLRGPADSYFGVRRDAKGIRQREVHRDGVGAKIVELDRLRQEPLLPAHAVPGPDEPDTMATREARIERGPIAGNARQRKIVAVNKAEDERRVLDPSGALGHREDAAHVGMARHHLPRARKQQGVDGRLRPRRLDRPEQWRREEDVSQAPGDDHQHACGRRHRRSARAGDNSTHCAR